MKLKSVVVICLILLVIMTFSAGCSKGLVTKLGLRSAAAAYHASEAYEPEELISDSQYLQYDHAQTYELWGEKGACFDISVKSSGNIDILIFDVENYIKYNKGFENGINQRFRGYFYKNLNSKDFQFTLPESGTYYLVIENSKFITNGADAKRGVNIEVSVI